MLFSPQDNDCQLQACGVLIPIAKVYCHPTASAWVTSHKCLFFKSDMTRQQQTDCTIVLQRRLHKERHLFVTSVQVYSCRLAAKNCCKVFHKHYPKQIALHKYVHALLAAHIETSRILDCVHWTDNEGQKTQGLVQLRCLESCRISGTNRAARLTQHWQFTVGSDQFLF